MPELANIHVDRHFRQVDCMNKATLHTRRLHTFTDAPEATFAAVYYAHQAQDDDSAFVALAMVRAYPAPMKKRSILMLEL